MSEKNYFKDQLGDYESPLSDRVSFDKVIIKTNKKAAGGWMTPKTIILAGLALTIGTSFIIYSQNDYSEASHSEGVASAQISNAKISKNTIESKAILLADAADSKPELLDKSALIERSSTSEEQPIPNNLASNLISETSGFNMNRGKSVVPVASIAKNKELEAFQGKKSGIPVQETINRNIPEAVVDTKNDFSKKLSPQLEKEEDHSSLVKEIAKSDAHPKATLIAEVKPSLKPVVLLDADKTNSPEAKKLKKGDAPQESSRLKVEFSLISLGSNVYGQINEDAFIAGNQRNFALQSVLSKEILDKIQIGLGIGYGLNESIGKYEWLTKIEEQLITSKQQIIVQPGLPDRIVTTYDTSFTSKLQNRTSDLVYKSEYVSLPIGLRYKVKDFGLFKILAAYTFEPGLLLVNSGHVFNTSEVRNTTDKLSNYLVIQNKFSARITYNLGQKWSFLVEPMYSNTYYSEKVLNINNSSKFGIGVGLIFNL
jgi:hypothetical protein